MFGLIICAGPVDDYAKHARMLGGLPSADFVVCADGGLNHFDALLRVGAFGGQTPRAAPDAAIGDFDSVDGSLLGAFERKGTAIVRHPPKKDFTDSELAFRCAAANGCDAILALGALGGRIDHAYANLQLLARVAGDGARAALWDGRNAITALRGGATARSSLRILRHAFLASALGLPANPQPNGAAQNLPKGATPNVAQDMPQSVPQSAPPKISILPIGGAAVGVRTHGLAYPISGITLPADYTVGVSNEFESDDAQISVESGAILVIASMD